MNHQLLARLVLLFFMACAAFTYPLLSIPDRSQLKAGAPILIWYLFGVWAVLIALTAYWAYTQRKNRGERP